MKITKINTAQGFALLLSLIVTSIVLASISLFIKKSGMMISKSGQKRRLTEIELKAVSGIERAKADLRSIVIGKGFAKAKNLLTQEYLSAQEKINQGLMPPTDLLNRSQMVPRIYSQETLKDLYEISVIYIPSERNIIENVDYDHAYPKSFTIISQARNLSTGEHFTTEALLRIDEGLKNNILAFAVLGDTPLASGELLGTQLPVGVEKFEFKPGTYDGRVYFGNFLPQSLSFGFTRLNQVNGVKQFDTKHSFEDRVLFLHKSSDSEEGPFIRSSGTTLTFNAANGQEDEGFDEGVDLEEAPSLQDMLPSIRHESTAQTQSNRPKPIAISHILQTEGISSLVKDSHLCLQYGVLADDTPTIDFFECHPDHPNPRQRYKGIGHKVVLSGSKDAYRYIDCEHTLCHVKGIIASDQMIVSDEDIYIEGDIVYQTGATNAPASRFQLVANKNIVIPPPIPLQVPLTLTNYSPLKPDGSPETETENNGVTNFIVPNSLDIQMWSSEYDKVSDSASAGFPVQSARVLDLHGAYFSVQGGIKLEGIWEPNHALINPYPQKVFDRYWDHNLTELVANSDNELKPVKVNKPVMGATIMGIIPNDESDPGDDEYKRFDATKIALLNGLSAEDFENGANWVSKVKQEIVKDVYKNNGLEPLFFFRPGINQDNEQGLQVVKRPDVIGGLCTNSGDLATCGHTSIALRSRAELLWMYGMLITKEYSWTRRMFNGNINGFRKRVIHFDTQFSETPPAGYKSKSIHANGTLAMQTLWQKSYVGHSQVLKHTSHMLAGN